MESLQCDYGRFDLGEGFDALATILAAPAGLLVSACRSCVIGPGAVDPDRASLNFLHHHVGDAEIAVQIWAARP